MILRNVRLLDDSLRDIQWDSQGNYHFSASSTGDPTPNPQRDDLSSPSKRVSSDMIDAKGSILIPGGLVHPHVHLDKCYLLDKTPIGDGTFQEALRETGKAKASFEQDDIISRGRRLITTSISHGVTRMRAHVEVDPTVNHLCLSSGLSLREEFRESIQVNLVVFAQDPIFYSSDPQKQDQMRSLLETAFSQNEGLNCIGSTPYVEDSLSNSKKNIDFTFDLARRFGLDLDFHLDYDLDKGKESLLWYVLKVAKDSPKWKVKESGDSRQYRITLGHCTKLCLFNSSEFDSLAKEIGSSGIEVSFVSLPHSDLYMQARNLDYSERIRSTLPGFELTRRGIKTSLGVNNVGNLFTPQGDADPLALLPMMVSIWQGAKEEDMKGLLEMVTSSASYSAGGSEEPSYSSATLIDGCKDLQSIVLSPTFGRTTIFNGKLVSRRVVDTELKLG